jgi:hypothetical protein
MAKAKAPAPIDTTLGTQAYALAVQHEAALDPRLPANTVANLAEDLTTLGASPPAVTTTPAPATPSPTTAAAAPTLAEATTVAVSLISGVHEALVGAKAKPAVRKAYGVAGKTPTTEAKAVLAVGAKIVTQAQADPSEALALGILPADVTALSQALAGVTAAESAAMGSAAKAVGTGKERHAAEVRMHEAVARIAGAGALAFATSAVVRAQFEALKVKKKG